MAGDARAVEGVAMFIQVIQGKLRDADLWRQQEERWKADLKPGAVGYLGATRGVTDDGQAVLFARFESEAAARANSQRPEQGAWWEQSAPAFDGEPRFLDCTEVDLIFDGGSDQAGFVQVISGRAVDPAKVRAAGQAMEEAIGSARPDVLGGFVAWHGDRYFTQAIYFTSEEDARKGEAAMQDDPEMAAWDDLLDGPLEFLDIRNPTFD